MNEITILIAEDNAINQKVALKMLSKMNISADIVVNGVDAVKAVQNKHYDLVFMDVQMPELDGLEATKRIREIEVPPLHTTIVAMTANALQGDRERCLEAGMDDYLSKPIKQADLKAMIKKWTSMNIQAPNIIDQTTTSISHQVIDPKRIAEIIELGDEALLLELMSLFLADGKTSVIEIETSITTNDAVQLRESSHKLKGSSANLGIITLQQICSSIEDFARNNEIEKAKSFLQPLLKEFEIVQQYIRKTYSV